MGRSMIQRWIIVFLVLFILIMFDNSGYCNPPGMKAPWPGGISVRCNQGNLSPFSHNTPFTCYSWDFDLPMNYPVVAATDGVVSIAGCNRIDGYGNRVRIKNSNGTYSLYAHLNSFFVAVNQPIKQGQIIAYSGISGNVTGPHLHFSITNKATYGLPSRFSDIGVPVEGGYYTSQNYLCK